MSYKVKAKDIKNNRIIPYIIALPFGALQSMLSFETPIAHTEGVYGWNYDVYHIGDYTICTGYREMLGKVASNDLVKEFEKKSESVCWSDMTEYEKSDRLHKMALEFCYKVINC